MAAQEPLYDLMLLLDTAADNDRRTEILSNVEKAITAGGTVVGKHEWGVRAMAYEIRHKGDADYHLIQFHGSGELLANLQRTLRITDGVLRFRIIKLEPGTPPPPRPERAAPAEAEAPTPA
jgi:small subunit ribosomal protein S6